MATIILCSVILPPNISPEIPVEPTGVGVSGAVSATVANVIDNAEYADAVVLVVPPDYASVLPKNAFTCPHSIVVDNKDPWNAAFRHAIELSKEQKYNLQTTYAFIVPSISRIRGILPEVLSLPSYTVDEEKNEHTDINICLLRLDKDWLFRGVLRGTWVQASRDRECPQYNMPKKNGIVSSQDTLDIEGRHTDTEEQHAEEDREHTEVEEHHTEIDREHASIEEQHTDTEENRIEKNISSNPRLAHTSSIDNHLEGISLITIHEYSDYYLTMLSTRMLDERHPMYVLEFARHLHERERKEDAIKAYEEVITLLSSSNSGNTPYDTTGEKYKEEMYYSTYMIGRCYEDLGDWDRALVYYTRAYAGMPMRGEALYRMSKYYRVKSKTDFSYILAKIGVGIPDPTCVGTQQSMNAICNINTSSVSDVHESKEHTEGQHTDNTDTEGQHTDNTDIEGQHTEGHKLGIDRAVYKYRFYEDLSITSYYVKDMNLGMEAADLLVLSDVPESVKKCAYDNILFYIRPLQIEIHPVEIVRPLIKLSSSEQYRPSSSCIWRGIDVHGRPYRGYTILCRTVNYNQSKGSYIAVDDDGIIRTRNFLLTVDEELKTKEQIEIVESLERTKYPSRVIGMEDCRLVRCDNRWWFLACTYDTKPGAFCPRVTLCRLAPEVTNGVYNVDMYLPLLGPDPNRPEKNWLLFTLNDQLRIVYSPGTIYSPILETGECEVLTENKIGFDTSKFRGSCSPIPFDMNGESGFLYITHEVVFRGKDRVYVHRFLWMDAMYDIVYKSHLFRYQHEGIEFCCGMSYDLKGKNILIGGSKEDREAFIYKVSIQHVRELLHPIEVL